MKKPLYALALVSFVVLAFLAGAWQGRHGAASHPSQARKPLYYVDPMHPSYRSDKPGIAPDCGMQLEPVFADGDASTMSSAPGRPAAGAVRVSPERQQLIGVRVGTAEKGATTRTIRTVGRAAADETRVYRLTVGTSGLVRQVAPNAVGTFVQKDELLATFFSTSFLPAQQAYFFALSAVDRFKETGRDTPEQMKATGVQVRQATEELRNMGVGDLQIEALGRTRTLVQEVEVRSPVTGFVVARNIAVGQRFDASAEFFRIADLSRVWVLADVFENEVRFVKAGQPARVVAGRGANTFSARVSRVLPQFDASSRTLKVRLDVDNPGYALRPDMFVDVEFQVTLPPALTVPADAILDTGLRRTVFVDRGDGHFEPRQVETGWRLGDRVEIVRGLMEGEKIVVSGNFLIDSESRMKAAAAGITSTAVQDPVCRMDVDEAKARAAGRTIERDGRTYAFCSDICKKDFEKEPARYAAKP